MLDLGLLDWMLIAILIRMGGAVRKALVAYRTTVKPPHNGTLKSSQTLYRGQTEWHQILTYWFKVFLTLAVVTLYSEKRLKHLHKQCYFSPPIASQFQKHAPNHKTTPQITNIYKRG